MRAFPAPLRDRFPAMQAPQDTKKRAVVLLSGGLDSTTVAAKLIAEGFEVLALTVHYGQRHAVELQAAQAIAKHLGCVEHQVLHLDLRGIGGSALTDATWEVPKGDTPQSPVASDIPVTYVPARNTLFLSLALGFAEARGIQTIAIGVNALDYSGYPDCRPEFIEQFERLANLATKDGVEGRSVRILAPLQDWTKEQIWKEALALRAPVALTFSCYDPDDQGQACGLCDSCRLRAQANAAVELREVSVDDAFIDLRHRNLRAGQPRESAFYPGVDDADDTFHLGAFLGEKLVGLATLQTDPIESCELRIRGMAVDEATRGLGIGSALVMHLQRRAEALGTGIWCNARILAVPMYERCGFSICSEEFEIPLIGPHFDMRWLPPSQPS